MKVVAYTPLHYGKAYLRWAIESVRPFVDKHVILYTPQPSYGHASTQTCPDSFWELHEIVAAFDHTEWHAGNWTNESDHRNAVFEHLRGYDLLLPVDADEVIDPRDLQLSLEMVYNTNCARNWLNHGFIHMWRSFHWSCTDAMSPVRMIDLRHDDGTDSFRCKTFHFGYAQPIRLMDYKWSCHGHIAELKPGWLQRKYINWRPGIDDVHPTCDDIWNPRIFDQLTMPEVLWNHPYWGKGLIE
jgi:hypothetical protein